jgi:hypothetical protein
MGQGISKYRVRGQAWFDFLSRIIYVQSFGVRADS